MICLSLLCFYPYLMLCSLFVLHKTTKKHIFAVNTSLLISVLISLINKATCFNLLCYSHCWWYWMVWRWPWFVEKCCLKCLQLTVISVNFYWRQRSVSLHFPVVNKENALVRVHSNYFCPLFVLYEVWFFILRVECRLVVFDNSLLKRIFWSTKDEVGEGWRKLHNEGFIASTVEKCSVVFGSRRIKWTGFVIHVREMYAG